MEGIGSWVGDFERVDHESRLIDIVLRDSRKGDVAQAYGDDDDADQEED